MILPLRLARRLLNNKNKMNQTSTYAYIAGAATTQVKTGNGKLRRIILGETAAGAITIYDETASATDNIIAVLKASVAENYFEFNCTFQRGLKIVTAAASKLTVIYE